MASNNNSAPLVIMSAELRNRIYDALIPCQTVEITARGLAGSQAITQVCQQTRQDAVRLYYARTNFVAHIRNDADAQRVTCWAGGIAGENGDEISQLRLVFHPSYPQGRRRLTDILLQSALFCAGIRFEAVEWVVLPLQERAERWYTQRTNCGIAADFEEMMREEYRSLADDYAECERAEDDDDE